MCLFMLVSESSRRSQSTEESDNDRRPSSGDLFVLCVALYH